MFKVQNEWDKLLKEELQRYCHEMKNHPALGASNISVNERVRE